MTSGKPEQRWIAPLGLATAAVILTALSLYQIGDRSFWLDEADSVLFASAPLGDLLTLVNRDVPKVETLNMALYYVVLHFWLGIGDSEAGVRSLSTLFGLVTLAPVYLIGRRIGGVRAGLASALIFAASAFTIRYDQEARAYSLFMLASVTLTGLLLRATDRPSAWRFLAYGAVAAVGLYVHFFMVFVLLSHAVWLAAARPRFSARLLIPAAIPIAIGSVPIALGIFANPRELDWIPPLDLASVGSALVTATGSPVALAVAAGIVVAAILAVPGDRRAILLLVSAVVTPVVAILAISWFKPLLVGRYLAEIVPPLAVLAGVTLLSIRPAGLRWAATIGYVGVLVVGLVMVYLRPVSEDWRAAGQWVADAAVAGDRIVFKAASSEWPLELYRRRAHGSVDPVATDKTGALALPAGDRVWYVVRITAEDRSSDLGRLAERYAVQESRRFGAFVRVYLLTARA
jgi:mannosyltransferase